jgi:hypothetical protein
MIVAFLYIFALLEFGGGIGMFVGGLQDPKVLGSVAIGFAILTVGLAGILMEVGRSRALLERNKHSGPGRPNLTHKH